MEFDAFGFSVKDFLTRRVLLRCDSAGDLYPVTAPSLTPHAFLVSQHTWHQRIGHPGGEVLRRLVSSNFISYNKEKPLVLRYKAHLVANGGTQLEGVDVDETFSPVVKPGTIWTVLSLAAFRHWPIHQLDVKNDFLHGDLSETVYMHQPLGFQDSTHLDYKKYVIEILKKAHMVSRNLSRTPVGTESKLGVDCDPVSELTLYRSLASSLQYLTFTRLDISYAVQQVFLHMHDHREPHLFTLKRILRYVQGTMNYGLQLFSSSTIDLVAYSNADWAGCPTTRRSNSGYYVFLGNNLLSWSAKRQPTLSRFSVKHSIVHQRTKHIEIDIHFVCDLVDAGQEYFLEFTSEYGISEDGHPELPGPEDRIVDFSKDFSRWTKEYFPPPWTGAHMLRRTRCQQRTPTRSNVAVLNTRQTPIQKQPEILLCLVGLSRRYYLGDDVYPTFLHDDDRDMDLFNLTSAPNPSKVKTGLRPRAAHEVPLLTATASWVIDMEDPDAATESSRTPSTVEKSPLDFDNENPASPMTEGAASKVREEEVAALEPRVRKKRGRKGNDGADANAPPKLLRKDYASVHLKQSTHREKSLPMMGLAAGPHPEQSMTQSYEILIRNVATMEVQDTRSVESVRLGKSTSSSSMVGSPGEIYQPGWGMTNSCRLDTPDACQNVVDHMVPSGYFFELRHMPNVEFLSQYNKELTQQVAMGSQLRLRFEQEVRLLKKARAQIARRGQRTQVREEKIKKLDQEIQGLQKQTSDLKTLLKAETDMKKATETKNADLTKELESLQLRQVYVDVVSARIAKGMSEGLKYRVEHKKANLDLEAIEAYDLEAETKYVAALHALRDLKYPMVDHLELLKDASIDVVMESLHLESNSGEDAPQWIRELHLSSSQLKIHVYPEVRDPKDSWAFKEEILLADAITANVSHAEKKKNAEWCVVPMGSVLRIMPGMMMFQCQCLPLLRKVLLSCWRTLLHKRRHPRAGPLQGYLGLTLYQSCIT
uniref:Ribonuclease H-like domain-containing protein n=1 Tax=Tanacetum cinerariifolium TaxID=118510 RepID=A0A6L2K018_TANCI|nr:ribonuclease H-like domain-containing protein [Tanacetum cinerariifolium]